MKKVSKSIIPIVLAAIVPAVSFAAVPADVTTNLQTAATDIASVGSLVFIAMVAAAAFRYLRRAL